MQSAATTYTRKPNDGVDQLWLFDCGVILRNLWLIGQYTHVGVAALLLPFGFVIEYEPVLVRPVEKLKKSAK
jgi:hypothetical protein